MLRAAASSCASSRVSWTHAPGVLRLPDDQGKRSYIVAAQLPRAAVEDDVDGHGVMGHYSRA